jgi:transposase
MSKSAKVLECHAVIDVLAQEVGHLREQMSWLQERLKVDSRNSSRPPSSDGPGSGNRAQQRASQRKRGAQKGYPGSCPALLPVSEVDSVQDCAPADVCECGGTVAVQGKPVRHQVFDIPPVQPEVREYQLYSISSSSRASMHIATCLRTLASAY